MILVSARAGEESRVEGLQADADDYLVKPFTAPELLARVATHVKMAHLRRVTAEREERLRNEVSLRTGEFGVRMTLGASGSNIMRLVFQRGICGLAVGLIVGLLGAFAATQTLEAMLVGVSPADPLSFAISTTVLVVAGLLECAVPARRAIRVDPVIVLRHNWLPQLSRAALRLRERCTNSTQR